jgi:hypothetical protein
VVLGFVEQKKDGYPKTTALKLTMNCKLTKKYALNVQFVQILCDVCNLQPLLERLYIRFCECQLSLPEGLRNVSNVTPIKSLLVLW